MNTQKKWDFPGGSNGKASAYNMGDLGSIPGSGRSPGEGNGNPFQYSCHLFLISSASVRSIPFLSCIEPIFAWNVHWVSLIFLKRSLVFPILFFPLFLCTDRWGRLSYLCLLFLGTLHSNGYIFPFLLCLSMILFYSQLCKASSDNHLAFLHLFFLGMVLTTASVYTCHEPPS